MSFAGIVVAANSAGAAELTGSELAPAAKFAGAADVPGAAVGLCMVIICVSKKVVVIVIVVVMTVCDSPVP
jgi:hypothetical protein